MHCKARDYKRRIRARNLVKKNEGKKPIEGLAVEMNNFQNPQVGYLSVTSQPIR